MTKDELLLRIREGGELTREHQLRLVALLSVPAIVAQVSNILMNYIDAAMTGSLGANPSASIGLVSTTLWLFWSVVSCVSTGFSVQVAHRIGANDFRGARDVLRQSIVSSIVVSVLTALVGAAIAWQLPVWLGGEEVIRHDATVYFLIFVLGMPLAMMDMLAGAMLRCAGDMKTPSVANIVMCVLDILFNFFLIFPSRMVELMGHPLWIPGAGWGVAGAAVGTCLAEAVVAGWLMWYATVRSKELALWQEVGSFLPTKVTLKRAYGIAAPMFVQRVVMNVAQIVSTMIVAPLGAVAIAANSFGITAESLCYMPGYGIGEAATTLVGQSLGAGRKDLTRRLAWMTVWVGILVMTLMGAVMWLGAPWMMDLLTPVEEVRRLGAECLRIEAWAEPMFAASIVAYGVFVGAGDTMKPAVMNLVSMWAVRITLAAVLAPTMGLHGVWIAMAIELSFRGLIFLARLKWGGWIRELK
ncbi:MAG: MATE family efflux transporter [Bacteroidaceae bacterium]|nr:MATE family efflux transporter [Bacteroidaceae bacterium]